MSRRGATRAFFSQNGFTPAGSLGMIPWAALSQPFKGAIPVFAAKSVKMEPSAWRWGDRRVCRSCTIRRFSQSPAC